MRKNRIPETDEQRDERLEVATRAHRQAADAEAAQLDALVRQSIRLHGACVGCPSSSITLQHGIERNLRHHVPEVRGVTAID